jgi:polysaccharide deacetylase 2 family uncharacterized protein YibQ
MAQTDDNTQTDVPTTGAGRVFENVLRHPFLASIAIGVLSALIFGLVLPGQDHTPEDTTIQVTSSAPDTIEPAPSAETPSTPIEEAAAEPAIPGVPIVAEVAVVIADAGLNRKVSEQIDKDMPRDATLAVSVYASDPSGTASAFKASGRDVWLQIAMQSTAGGIDPGPLAASSSLSTTENMALLRRQVATAGGNVVGLYIPDDADIPGNDPDMWRDIALNLIGENLMIMDATKAKVATTLYLQKREAQISAYLKTDIIINGDMGPVVLQKALADALPIILREQEAIVVMAHPTPLAVQTLAEWVKSLPAKGIRLVPAAKFTGLKG